MNASTSRPGRAVGTLPRPNDTGGSPASRNRTSSAGGSHPTGALVGRYPVTWIRGCQSAGRGSTSGLYA